MSLQEIELLFKGIVVCTKQNGQIIYIYIHKDKHLYTLDRLPCSQSSWNGMSSIPLMKTLFVCCIYCKRNTFKPEMTVCLGFVVRERNRKSAYENECSAVGLSMTIRF